jgi:hypothetical protein
MGKKQGKEARRPVILTVGKSILCGVALWLALVLMYAGPMAAAAAYCLIVDGGLVLLWVVAAVGIGSWILPLFLGPNAHGVNLPLRLATSAALGLGVIGLIVLGLGLAGAINRIVAFVLIAAGVLAAFLKLWRAPVEVVAIRQRFGEPAGWGWLLLLIVPLLAVMTVGDLLPPYVLWNPEEPHGYDVVEYHLQVPREWFEAGRIIPLHHNVFSFFPFNVEMHYLLAMHLRGGPWAGMYAAQLMHGAFILLTVLSVGGIAATMFSDPARSRIASVVAMLAMAGAPLVWQLGAIAYDEGGFLLFGTLAIGWAMVAARDPQKSIGRMALAGVMAGLACGAKLTAVPEVLVAVAVVSGIVLLARRASVGGAAARVAIFGVCALACFAPWLIRTWLWAGNPVFPELPQLGHGYFSEVQVERWRHAHAARPDQRSITARLEAGWTQVLGNWQFGFLVIPLAVIGGGIGWREPNVWFLGTMLFLLAVFWLGFTHLQGRFFVLAIPICALLVATMPPRALLGAVSVQVVMAIIVLNTQFLGGQRPEFIHGLLGTDDLSLMIPPAASSVPGDATLTLVGDARAFVYQRPMVRLKYRTVFGADTSSGDVIAAWAGPPAAGHEQWLLIDPVELERFARTYPPFPPLPAEVLAQHEPYMVRR